MSRSLIEAAKFAVDLAPAPIEKSWIIEGNPVAQNRVLFNSQDGLAQTIVWQCSEGKFNWYYDFDETVFILEGSIVLENDNMPATRFGPGDVIVFNNGAHARWHVEGHVRKLAFCRKPQPYLLSLVGRVVSKVSRLIFRSEPNRHTLLANT